MSSMFANKFQIEVADTARIIFMDQRAAQPDGSMPTKVVAEIVVSPANLKALSDCMLEVMAKIEKIGATTQ